MDKKLKYVVAAASLILIVGALAWVTQHMPNWRTRTIDSPKGNPAAANPLKFSFSQENVALARRDPKMRKDLYIRPYEKDASGYFDFPFQNLSEQNAELGFHLSTCDCYGVKVAFVPSHEWERYEKEILSDPMTAQAGPWQWEDLPKHETKGILVPAGSKGFVRIAWTARKEPGTKLLIKPTMWIQPEGRPTERTFERLEVPVVVIPPLEFSPAKSDTLVLGAKGTNSTKFLLWSYTRTPDKLKLTLSDEAKKNPLFDLDLKPLPEDEIRSVTSYKDPIFDHHVLAAYELKVTVHEQAGDKQLDQGMSFYFPKLLIDGEKLPTDPLVQVSVKGDVQIGAGKNEGKVDLESFTAADGTRAKVYLWTTTPKMELAPAKQELASVEVKLTKQETTGNRTKWLLEVVVPPGALSGSIPEHSAVILQTQSTPPRYIRIPVSGIAVQG